MCLPHKHTGLQMNVTASYALRLMYLVFNINIHSSVLRSNQGNALLKYNKIALVSVQSQKCITCRIISGGLRHMFDITCLTSHVLHLHLAGHLAYTCTICVPCQTHRLAIASVML